MMKETIYKIFVLLAVTIFIIAIGSIAIFLSITILFLIGVLALISRLQSKYRKKKKTYIYPPEKP